MKHGHHSPALLSILLSMLLATTAWGEECVLLQSSALKPYEEARQGFERAWVGEQPHLEPRRITLGTLTQILLSNQPQENLNALKKQLQQAQLVVVIGDPALDFVRDLVQTPVLYLLAPSAAKLPANFTGIDLRILPSRQLETMSRLMPKVHRIGALYNPAQNGQWVQQALLNQVSAVDTLLFKKVSSPALVPEALSSLEHSIDAYWLLPDELLANPQTMEHLRDFSIANRIPIISFSDKYLKAGAAVAITFDMADMGSQAAEMSARILAGSKAGDIPVETPRRQRVIVNTQVLHRMGVVIFEAAVDEIYPGESKP
jgi:putative ABC transport system substrate-binding protein